MSFRQLGESQVVTEPRSGHVPPALHCVRPHQMKADPRWQHLRSVSLSSMDLYAAVRWRLAGHPISPACAGMPNLPPRHLGPQRDSAYEAQAFALRWRSRQHLLRTQCPGQFAQHDVARRRDAIQAISTPGHHFLQKRGKCRGSGTTELCSLT
jgi:hypothetical protein